MKRSHIIQQFQDCLAGWDVCVFPNAKGRELSWQQAAVRSVGPRGHSTGSKLGWRVFLWGGGEGGSAGSHSGMFQLTGHVLPHCSVGAVIRMYAYKACWEQASDIWKYMAGGKDW